MKLLLVITLFVAVFSVRAQTVANTSNVLHPIMKDPNHRYAPTSLDQDPSVGAEFQTTAPARPARQSSIQAAQPAAPARPAEIIAQIDGGVAVSKISLTGTVNGLKGSLYVTNIGSETVLPLAQFAVCDQKGFQIGSTAKMGQPLAPHNFEKIEVLATNLNAVDLKLIRLAAGFQKQ